MTDTTRTNNLFRPAIAPSKRGGLVVHQGEQRMHIADGEVEAWIEELKLVRARQLERDCRRIVGAPPLLELVDAEEGS